MRSARLITQGQPLEIGISEKPRPERGEILVKLDACGVCHTDVHIRDGDEELLEGTLPLTQGNEGIGKIVELGEDVTGFALGDRVAAPWLHDTCLACRDCLTGHENICASQRAHGMQVDGAFADYVRVKADFTVPVPDALDAVTAAPLLCAGLTAYGAVRKAALAPGQRCAIFGCGGLGQYGIRLAALAGASVVAIDTDPAKLDVARSLGAQ